MITKQQAKVEKAQIFQAQQVPITSKQHQKHDIHDINLNITKIECVGMYTTVQTSYSKIYNLNRETQS